MNQNEDIKVSAPIELPKFTKLRKRHEKELAKESDDSSVSDEKRGGGGKNSNKEWSRRARVRKKKYIEELEDKLRDLEKENEDLKERNEELVSKVAFLEAGGAKMTSIDKF